MSLAESDYVSLRVVNHAFTRHPCLRALRGVLVVLAELAHYWHTTRLRDHTRESVG